MENKLLPQAATGPLAGVRILDLTRALSGPFATLMLVGLGATIVRVEEPRQESRENAPFLGPDGPSLRRQTTDDVSIGHLIRHRGKQSITLNLKHPDAPKIFAQLVPHFDVVVENYTRGTAERLNVGYTAAKEAKPDIIYCSISGFGQEGTSGGGKAMDTVIQAMSGAMMTSGSPGDPPVRMGVPFADLTTPLFAVIGIVSALYHHKNTGEGQYIDVSMLGALTALQAAEPFEILDKLGIPMRAGLTMPRLAPFGVYPAEDGDIVLCCSGDRNFKLLAGVMGTPDLANEKRFKTQADRMNHFVELDEIVTAWTRAHTVDSIAAKLDEANIAYGPVRTPGQASRDPRVLQREEIVRLKHPVHGGETDVYAPGVPIRFSSTTARIPEATATLGAHNDQIYGDLLNLAADEIAELKRSGLF